MNPVMFLIAIPALAMITCFLMIVSQKLYLRIYEPHISFEPLSQFKTPISTQVTHFTLLSIAFMMAPLFLWSQGYAYSSEFLFLCGYTITYFLSYISRAVTSVLTYKYLQKHPHIVHGKAVFQSPFLPVLNATISLQQLILVAGISFFMPRSSFIYGALFCLIASILIHYFSRNRKVRTC
jgi:hypothetical protein